MRSYWNCIRRYTKYRVGLNSKKCTEYIQLGYSCNLAIWVEDLDKINKEILRLWERQQESLATAQEYIARADRLRKQLEVLYIKQQDIVAKEIDKIEKLERIENALDINNPLIWNMDLEIFEVFQSPLDPNKTQTIESSVGSFSNSWWVSRYSPSIDIPSI